MIKKVVRECLSKIKGNSFYKEYLELNKIDNSDTLLNFQKIHLSSLLLHAYKNVPYYSQILRDAQVIENEKISLSNFNRIPTLKKEIIQANFSQLISRDYQTRKWQYNSSGGSTGEPVRFIQDNFYLKWRNATNYYYYKNILGVDEPNVKKILLWGSERDLFQGSLGLKANFSNWLSNTVFLNSFKMTEKDIETYIKIINSLHPELLRGYAGSLHELCKYIKQKNMTMYCPKFIVSTAENLSDDMRSTIESIFRTKMYNLYGSREVSIIAGECTEGNIHTFTFWNYIEVLDKDNNPVKVGEEGRVVVTNLFNYSMPLIRYEIGDTAIVGQILCSCGNVLPTLKKVTGRITNHFVLKDGTTIPAEFFIHLMGVVCNNGDINKFQVIQEDYNIIRILVVPRAEMTDIFKNDIESKIKLVMGQNCVIRWDIVAEIPKTKSGKYIYTKSLLWK